MANKNTVQEAFPVLGMSCASCAARIDKTLNHQPGVSKAAVNYASGVATVEYDRSQCTPETLQQAVQAAGYDLLIKQDENTLDEVEQVHNKKYRALKFRTTCQPHYVDTLHPCRLLAGKKFLRQCLEAAEAWQRQYGYAGSQQYRNCLCVQPVQYAFPRLLDGKRHSSACLF